MQCKVHEDSVQFQFISNFLTVNILKLKKTARKEIYIPRSQNYYS